MESSSEFIKKGEIMGLKEWAVSCEWCGAEKGDPCRSERNVIYMNQIHIPRRRLYDLIENRPVLLPPKPRYAKRSSGIRSSAPKVNEE